MYKTILVPLDGSARAERILPHVEELALKFGAKVILLQVIDPGHSIPAPGQLQYNLKVIERERKEAGLYLDAKRSAVGERGIRADIRVEFGLVASTIITVADSENVDLIAMASHGRGV